MNAELLDDLRATTREALTAANGGDIVDQLDLSGLLVDDDRGGLGMGELEMVLVAEEIGRRAAKSSFLESAVLGATLSGVVVEPNLAVVIAGRDGSWATASNDVSATSTEDGGWHVRGTAWAVAASPSPSRVIAPAATGAGVALFEVEDIAFDAADEFDPGRGLIEVRLDAAARQLADPEATHQLLATAHRRALLAVGAEQLGVARACLEMTVEYAKTRSQFGAPIGSFQAIKHRCADVLLDTELADAVLKQAVHTGTLVDAELAFVVSTRAAVTAAESCIHIHGGIGFTWEHSAHWYLRRARSNATLLGAPGTHRAVIAESAGLNTEE
ncbi:acyl-CoA dehydrogenase family protein [Mycobacterium sp. GA-2829]|uniref:acyl-CoA dehydrogenase family protein n=1 Tax=Mycobacterium sp. GA-2829 TaxID=1772283 RepID=UPI00074042A5|nr:acyl-CoA dehydrogenase family protein [Mycobacterium sp. GA-2829]KUI29249.1 hypothetical protein AU194_20435 [Mycobacterium sp. GA-2829]